MSVASHTQTVYDSLSGWDASALPYVNRRELEVIMFYRDERLALFIDGSNLYAATKALGFDIDYKLLRSEFMRRLITAGVGTLP